MRRMILLPTTVGAMLLLYAGQVFATHLPPDLTIRYHDGPSKASPGETWVGYSASMYNQGGRARGQR